MKVILGVLILFTFAMVMTLQYKLFLYLSDLETWTSIDYLVALVALLFIGKGFGKTLIMAREKQNG